MYLILKLIDYIICDNHIHLILLTLEGLPIVKQGQRSQSKHMFVTFDLFKQWSVQVLITKWKVCDNHIFYNQSALKWGIV